MDTSIVVALITGVFAAVIAPAVNYFLRLGRIRAVKARRTTIEKTREERNKTSEPFSEVRKSWPGTLWVVATGALLGVFVGYFALAPMISRPFVQGARVTITSPTSSDRVSRVIIVQGVATNVRGEDLWVLVLPGGTTSYHPQGGPIPIASDGSWATSVQLGLADQTDVGRPFLIIAALAESNGSASMRNYLEKSQQDGRFSGIEPLPRDVRPVAQVTVTRDK